MTSTENKQENTPPHYRWNYICAVLSTPIIYGTALSTILPVYLQVLIDRLKVLRPEESLTTFFSDNAKTIIGVLPTLAWFAQFLPALISAKYMEMHERKMPFFWLFAVPGTVVLCLMNLSVWLAAGQHPISVFGLLYPLHMIALVCVGAHMVVFGDIVGKTIPLEKRAGLFGNRLGLGCLMIIVVGLVTARLLKADSELGKMRGYHAVFLITLAGMVFSYIWFALMREPPGLKRTERTSLWRFLAESCKVLLVEDRAFRLFFIVRALQMIAITGETFILLFMKEKLKLPDSIVGWSMIVTSATNAAAFFFFGWVGNRWGTKLLIQMSNVFGTLKFLVPISIPLIISLLVPIVDLRQSQSAVVGLFLFSIAIGATSYTCLSIGRFNYPLDIAPVKLRPTYVGFSNTGLLPFVLMMPLGGIVVDHSTYEALFIGCATIFLLALVPGYFMPNVRAVKQS